MPEANTSLMLAEIREQPEALARLIDHELGRVAELAAAARARGPSMLFLAARGTSDNAAVYAKYLAEIVLAIPAALAAPSVSTLYQVSLKLDRALVLGVSQSGRAADAIEVLRRARESGELTGAITNDPESPMAAAAEHPLYCHAGPERSLPATKTYTASLALLYALVAHLAGDAALLDDLKRVPELVGEALKLEEQIAHRVERYRYMDKCVVLARGLHLGTALETALKLSETSYLRAQPFGAADFLHGPIAVVEEGNPCILFAPAGKTYPVMVELTEALEKRNAETIILSDQEELLARATMPLRIPSTPEFLAAGEDDSGHAAGVEDVRVAAAAGRAEFRLAAQTAPGFGGDADGGVLGAPGITFVVALLLDRNRATVVSRCFFQALAQVADLLRQRLPAAAAGLDPEPGVLGDDVVRRPAAHAAEVGRGDRVDAAQAHPGDGAAGDLERADALFGREAGVGRAAGDVNLEPVVGRRLGDDRAGDAAGVEDEADAAGDHFRGERLGAQEADLLAGGQDHLEVAMRQVALIQHAHRFENLGDRSLVVRAEDRVAAGAENAVDLPDDEAHGRLDRVRMRRVEDPRRLGDRPGLLGDDVAGAVSLADEPALTQPFGAVAAHLPLLAGRTVERHQVQERLAQPGFLDQRL